MFVLVLPAGRADKPVELTNANATRTVLWTMDTPQNLTAAGVDVVGGHAVLSWVNQSLSWTTAGQILANGSGSPGMTGNASGLGMSADWTNYVRNPTFGSTASWVFLNGTSRNVTAEWNPSPGVGELDSKWAGDQVFWESMDHVIPTWTGLNALVVQNGSSYPTPVQGSGTMGVGVAGGLTYAAAVNSSTVSLNWSKYDRLVLDVYHNITVAATLNLTARAGSLGPVLTTSATPLQSGRGWQEVTVDLNQLSNSTVRRDLLQISLRFNAATTFSANTWFNVDNVRLGTAKVFNETATVTQIIQKSTPTTPLPGSARLSFDWFLRNDTNAEVSIPSVSLQVVGTPEFVPLTATGLGGSWHVFSSDVSAWTSSTGAYNLSFALHVAANTTAAYDIELLVDNVTLVFPDVTNGTFTSDVLSMGRSSEYVSAGWTGPTVAGTSVTLGIRTGNNSVPSSASWSAWYRVSVQGPASLAVPSAMNFQIRIDLNTTNASASPLVRSFTMQTRHRGPVGYLKSELYLPQPDFLRWRFLNASFSNGSSTSIQFFIGSGSSWNPVTPGAVISSNQGNRLIQWNATFASSDGLHTPVLTNVTLLYEYLGPPAVAVITVSGSTLAPGTILNVTSGQTVSLGVLVYDSGSHLIPATTYGQVWGLSNATGGSLSQNGIFTAGQLGLYEIVVTINEPGTSTFLHASIWVNITAASSLWDAWPFMAVGIAALLGFAIYELVVRRLFSIDDVFLIGKDGRLMSHNTRRMLADRDEDILSGMLTAINSFVRDSWREENSHVRRFVVGGKTTVVERGEHVFLAAVYSGRVPGWASRDIRALVDDLERYFGKEFATWSGSPEDLQSLREVMRRFASRVRYSRRRVWKGIAG